MRRNIYLTIALLFLLSFEAIAHVSDFVRFEAAKVYFKKGTVFFNNMQYLAAVEQFRKAIEKFSDYYTAREYLARSYKLSGLFDAALKEWENLYQINEENVALLGKIDSLRFQGIVTDDRFSTSLFTFNNVYQSSSFKRFGFRHPLDITLDNAKNLYVTSFSSGKLIKIDPNGNGIAISKGMINAKLYGIDCFNNTVVATDFRNDNYYIIDKRGTIVKRIGSSGNREGEFHGPEGVCFDPKGNIYVVDSANHRIQKFTPSGEFLLAFGKQGEYEGELQGPADITFHSDALYVTDTGNKRLASFDASGNFIKNFEIEGMAKPRGISSKDNLLLISDEKNGLLFYDTVTGEKNWFNEWENGKKNFSMLVASVYDRDGYLYCLDYNRESIYIFSHEKKHYSNLNVEITSVDTRSFPVVAFYLSIKGRDGMPLYGLTASNFSVTEDSAPITGASVNYLKKISPSVSIVFCVDRSHGNEGNHGEIPWVCEFVLKKMMKNDSAKVINFNSEVWEGSKFDWSRRRTLKALKAREYGAGKEIGKALYSALSDCLPRINRRGVLLITDGGVAKDSFVTYSPEDIIHYARSHYIPIYIIAFKEPHNLLKKIANDTGGALFRPNELDRLRSVYDSIKNLEEYRYVLVYGTFKLPQFKEWWSEVKIDVHYRGEKGHEWGGYFVP